MAADQLGSLTHIEQPVVTFGPYSGDDVVCDFGRTRPAQGADRRYRYGHCIDDIWIIAGRGAKRWTLIYL